VCKCNRGSAPSGRCSFSVALQAGSIHHVTFSADLVDDMVNITIQFPALELIGNNESCLSRPTQSIVVQFGLVHALRFDPFNNLPRDCEDVFPKVPRHDG
jgi:HupE / UreJ protein